MRVLCLVLLAALVVHAPQASPAPQRVLFIGNSLTAANDLPRMLETLARSAGGPAITCESVAYPNYSLEDHWARGDAQKAIARGGWTTVVLQQGPSALPESRVLLIAYARKFNAEIRRIGATPALYMVWPSAERRGDFEGVKTSYQAAAKEIGGVVLPVGDAWRAAWRHDARIELWGPDGFHPTPEATYLAALVIYERLAGPPPAVLAPPFALPSGHDAILRLAAAEANARAAGR